MLGGSLRLVQVKVSYPDNLNRSNRLEGAKMVRADIAAPMIPTRKLVMAAEAQINPGICEGWPERHTEMILLKMAALAVP